MKDNDDLLIASFFNEYGKNDIADNGFSERVMNRLPKREWSRLERMNIVWTSVCAVAAVALFFFADGVGLLKSFFLNFFADLVAYIVSINFSLTSLLMVLVTIVTLSILTTYNAVIAEA